MIDNFTHQGGKIDVKRRGQVVQVVVNGKKQLKSIQIDPSLLDASQLSILQDLLVAAINKAQENAEEIAKEHLAKATEGLLPSIPGMDLGSLFNK